MDAIASSAGVHSAHARTCINKQFHHRRCGRKHGHMEIGALPNHGKVRAIRAQRVVDPRYVKLCSFRKAYQRLRSGNIVAELGKLEQRPA